MRKKQILSVADIIKKKAWEKQRTLSVQSNRMLVKIPDLPNEIWVDVEGYENIYQVSNQERAKRLGHWIEDKNGKRYFKAEKIINFGGVKYPHVTLSKDAVKQTLLFHRLVAIAFIPNPENKPEVNHKRGYKFGHKPDNLEWATKPENEEHAYKMGFKKGQRGEDNYACKLTSKQVKEIRKKYKWRVYTAGMLAKEYGISQSHTIMIIHEKHRKYG